MKFYRETTVDWSSPTPNHTYLLNNTRDKMYGYIKLGTEEAVVFKKPYRFDARRRTFREVTELGEIDTDQVRGQQWEFAGSKGNKYIVQKLDNVLKCTCPGFTYRGECKHVKQIEEQV